MLALPAALALFVLLVECSRRRPVRPRDPGEGGASCFLSASASRQVHEVRIGPGTSLNLFFDAPVQLVELEAREHFRRVEVVEDSILLLASRELKPERRLRMPVRFVDGQPPSLVDFVLVVVPPGPGLSTRWRCSAPVPRRSARRRHGRSARRRGNARPSWSGSARCRRGWGTHGSARPGADGWPGRVRSSAPAHLAGRAGAPVAVGHQLSCYLSARGRRRRGAARDGAGGNGVVGGEREPSALDGAGAELVSEKGGRHALSVWQRGAIVPGAGKQRIVVEGGVAAGGVPGHLHARVVGGGAGASRHPWRRVLPMRPEGPGCYPDG